MCSSRGFASTTDNNKRPYQTRFRYGSAAEPLNLLSTVSRRIIMQKARRQAFPRSRQQTVDSRQQKAGLCRPPLPLGRQAPTQPSRPQTRARRIAVYCVLSTSWA